MQVSASDVQQFFSNVSMNYGFSLSAKQTQILFCSDQRSYGEVTTKLESLRSSDEVRVLPTKCWRSWKPAMDKVCFQQMLHKAFLGDQKKINRELEEIRVAQHWVNQEGWDVTSEAQIHSKSTGKVIDLHLDWGAVKKALAGGHDEAGDSDMSHVDEVTVLRDYSLKKLDPTQRVFADRVLKWAGKVADVYENARSDG